MANSARRGRGSAVEILVEQVLEVFLAPAVQNRLAQLEHDLLEFLESEPARLDFAAEAGIVAVVAGGDELRELAVGEHPSGELERHGVGVESANVRVEQIFKVDRGTAELGVEIETAGAKAAGAEDRGHGKRELLDVGVELVGVPTQQKVAGVGVDRSEQALRGRRLDLMLERVAGEGGVVGLDVELEMLVEAVGPQEGDAGGDIEIVLVLGGLLRLGLDQELAR